MRNRFVDIRTLLLLVVFSALSQTGFAGTLGAPYEVIHLSFENSLDNKGTGAVHGRAHSGAIKYLVGRNGMALQTQGDGSWVAYQPNDKIRLGNLVEISFFFKREKWKTKYRYQTIATVSGRYNKRLSHVSFGFYSREGSPFYVSFMDDKGKSHKIITRPDPVTYNWHHVMLRVDRRAGTTRLHFNGKPSKPINAVPEALLGVNKITLGTWFKKNQGYRGLIDEFVIAATPDS